MLTPPLNEVVAELYQLNQNLLASNTYSREINSLSKFLGLVISKAEAENLANDEDKQNLAKLLYSFFVLAEDRTKNKILSKFKFSNYEEVCKLHANFNLSENRFCKQYLEIFVSLKKPVEIGENLRNPPPEHTIVEPSNPQIALEDFPFLSPKQEEKIAALNKILLADYEDYKIAEKQANIQDIEKLVARMKKFITNQKVVIKLANMASNSKHYDEKTSDVSNSDKLSSEILASFYNEIESFRTDGKLKLSVSNKAWKASIGILANVAMIVVGAVLAGTIVAATGGTALILVGAAVAGGLITGVVPGIRVGIAAADNFEKRLLGNYQSALKEVLDAIEHPEIKLQFSSTATA